MSPQAAAHTDSAAEEFQHISVKPYAAALGAEINGVNLAEPIGPEVIEEIRRAWLENIVVFFRDQELTPQQQHDFLANFGPIRFPPPDQSFIPKDKDVQSVLIQEYDQASRIGADVDWHADNSFREIPQKCSVLYGVDIPATGGDTCWVNMVAAYEALAEPVRKMCDELTAIHDLVATMGPGVRAQAGNKAFTSFAERTPAVEHPVVRVNPDTGKRCLYVNPLMTARIKDVSPIESRAILDMLFAHCTQEEFMLRFKWQKGSVAFWDNRSAIHRGINDFYPQHRLMHRVSIDEECPPTGI
jgi:taurine dioxygenase